MHSPEVHRQVARLHADCINRGFLATLGPRFLALLYRAIDESDDSVLFVEMRDGKVVGFVSGGLGMRAIYRQMLRHPIRLAAALVPALVRPGTLARIWEILRYSGKSEAVRAEVHAELLSIAVHPDGRGGGVSESLYRRLVAHFRARGAGAFRIVVGEALEPAHRFYLRMGAAPAGRTEVHAGEVSIVYIHELSVPA